ncbi:MAG: PepSY domain-containing protein [Magnetococcales bacterium]|nr:PepSY domain-containing protein [Magnetococcales bacterium]
MKSGYRVLAAGRIDRWLGVALLVCALPLYAGEEGDLDHELARRLVGSGAILPLERILERHPQLREGRLLEVELERKHGRMVYEIEVVHPSGDVAKYHFDAGSGELLKKRTRED